MVTNKIKIKAKRKVCLDIGYQYFKEKSASNDVEREYLEYFITLEKFNKKDRIGIDQVTSNLKDFIKRIENDEPLTEQVYNIECAIFITGSFPLIRKKKLDKGAFKDQLVDQETMISQNDQKIDPELLELIQCAQRNQRKYNGEIILTCDPKDIENFSGISFFFFFFFFYNHH